MSDRRKVLDLFEEQNDTWRKRAAEGIERYRKGDGVVTVVDEAGNPVSNAKIKLTQKTHEFRFGANLFMLDELETDEKNEKYKKYFSDVFNMATLPFYWDALEPDRGKPRYAKHSPKVYRRPAPDLCIEFCEKHGIEPREHALAYDAFFPKWLYDVNVDEVKRELERRYAEISERYADKIRTIEVTNEMEWDMGKTAFYDESNYVEWCFKLAEKYFPQNQLCINEHTGLSWKDKCRATDKYYAYIEANMLKGARIDAIGMQYHLFNKAELEYEKTRLTLNPENLYKHMDMYATFGKPLQITEVTVPSYSWEDDDEEIQAKIIENLYSIWFSHPNVEQIIYWNLVDGYAHLWDPSPEKIKASQGDMTLGENYYHGGLLRFDMSPKPAYYKIKELLQEIWHTEEELVTDKDGCVEFRGFYGEYDLVITANGKTVTRKIQLSSKADNARSVIL
jgi:GH35 family endo-1,4-beta-xylanase